MDGLAIVVITAHQPPMNMTLRGCCRLGCPCRNQGFEPASQLMLTSIHWFCATSTVPLLVAVIAVGGTVAGCVHVLACSLVRVCAELHGGLVASTRLRRASYVQAAGSAVAVSNLRQRLWLLSSSPLGVIAVPVRLNIILVVTAFACARFLCFQPVCRSLDPRRRQAVAATVVSFAASRLPPC